MLQDIKNRLRQTDTLFFVVDGKPYGLSLKPGQEGNCDDISVLAPMLTEKYFTPLMALAEKGNWDAAEEQTAVQCGNHILLFLGEYNCTPEKTAETLNSFGEAQLSQLLEQLEVYSRIRPLYCKYKVRENV